MGIHHQSFFVYKIHHDGGLEVVVEYVGPTAEANAVAYARTAAESHRLLVSGGQGTSFSDSH